MKAILSVAPGGPETLVMRELPDPTPGARQVRVRVFACSVNYPDVLMIDDRYQLKPQRPFSPGIEIAGVIDALGPNAHPLQVGDRILGTAGFGGMAEKVLLSVDDCVTAPADMPLDEGSALLLTYGTAIHAFKDRARIEAGQTLLVLGAGGGVGLAGVELGKAMGARVIAIASSAEKVALAKARGADEGLLSPLGPLDRSASKTFTEQLKQACGPRGADAILDPVGGDFAEAALRAIAPRGRYLVIGFTAGIPKIPLNLVLLKECDLIGVLFGAFAKRDPQRNRTNLCELLALYGRGQIKPFISARFPLERAGEAIACLAERRALGKIIVTMT